MSITDEYMKQMLATTKPYTVMILRTGPAWNNVKTQSIVWEHGRRNFQLRADGHLSIVCPVTDESDIKGIGIFNVDSERAKEIMDDDPGVRAGIFVYELHPCRSFRGDSLPA